MAKNYNCHLCDLNFEAIPDDMLSPLDAELYKFVEVICSHCEEKYILKVETMQLVIPDFKGGFIIQE